jgi:hypothetical protein
MGARGILCPSFKENSIEMAVRIWDRRIDYNL